MSDELREKVARAIAAVPKKLQYSREEAWQQSLIEADAAIAIVRTETLEEAAREADKIAAAESALHDMDNDRYSQGKANGAKILAALFRALEDYSKEQLLERVNPNDKP